MEPVVAADVPELTLEVISNIWRRKSHQMLVQCGWRDVSRVWRRD